MLVPRLNDFPSDVRWYEVLHRVDWWPSDGLALYVAGRCRTAAPAGSLSSSF
ncbi:MAG: hypothetical protein KatS3mg082_2997 [Nitrospiraceae bacterium]|nr:MAG: hypothetical protein KatS3mg082_2997 [Nitrospiraceae bacterium]